MLASGKPASVYLPVLTGTIGYWMPSPDYAKPRAPKQNIQNQKYIDYINATSVI
jgi:hypothetical protein